MRILEPITANQDEMVAIRRDIHAHPETAYEEHRTAELIANKLTEWNIPVHQGMGITGVVGTITGNHPGAAIGLRADIDALPMPEQNTFAHASRHPGKMHACGHDGHTTMLLAAAKHLSENRDFPGTIYVIFQPAEEGFAGAQAMINDGLFTQFPMDAVFGMHNWPDLPAGEFAVIPGPIMASSNTFKITLKGKGAHAAMPNLGIDPVMVAVQLAQSLQTIISREMDPLDPAVLSITQIHSGSADNVIPDTAILRGTVRTFSDKALDLIEQRMKAISAHTSDAFQCQHDFEFTRVYPPTLNHPEMTQFCTDIMEELVGKDKVHRDIAPSMGAEDFAFMLAEKPGCYVWIGNGSGHHRDDGHGPGPCNLHNGSYDFNDEIIPLGASYWVHLARHWLKQHAA